MKHKMNKSVRVGLIVIVCVIFVPLITIAVFVKNLISPNINVGKEIRTVKSYLQGYNVSVIQKEKFEDKTTPISKRKFSDKYYLVSLKTKDGLNFNAVMFVESTFSGGFNNVSTYTDIMAKTYEKHENEIIDIAKKNNLKVDSQIRKLGGKSSDYKKYVIKTTKNQLNDINNFVIDLAKIDDISKLYTLKEKVEKKYDSDQRVLDDELEIYVYDKLTDRTYLTSFTPTMQLQEKYTEKTHLYSK